MGNGTFRKGMTRDEVMEIIGQRINDCDLFIADVRKRMTRLDEITAKSMKEISDKKRELCNLSRNVDVFVDSMKGGK